MDKDPYANAPDVGRAFTGSAFPALADQIGNVAANNTYTYLADPDHRDAALLEVTGHDDTMRALARSGVKHIALEYLGPGDQGVLDAYARGDVSERSMKYFIDEMVPQGVDTYMQSDESFHGPALYNLIRNARENGIKVHGVNGQEGAEDPEFMKQIFKDREKASLALVKEMDKNPAFFSMSNDEKYDHVRKTLAEAGLNASQVDQQMLVMGWDTFYDEKGEPDYTISEEFLLRRMLEDRKLSERIEDVTNGEKTVVLYGERHMNRAKKDLDAYLPGPVVTVYADKEAHREFIKEADNYAGARGFSPTDISEYSVDIKSGTWRDGVKKQMMPVDVPPLNSIPHTFEERPVPIPEPRPERDFAIP